LPARYYEYLCSYTVVLLLTVRLTPNSTLFPYTTPFRSRRYWVVALDCQRRTQFINVDLPEYRLLTLLKQQVNFAQLCQSCINDIPSEQIAGFLIRLINKWLERGWLAATTK